MKTKFFVLFVASFLSFSSIFAQVNCTQELSLFNDSAKAEIYDDAMPRYKKLIKECPKAGLALYQRADKMFEELIDKATEDAKKKDYAQMAIDNILLRIEHFPDKSPVGQMYSDIGKIMYENKMGSAEEIYKYFDDAWKMDQENFKSPVGLYIYFLILDNLVDAKKKTINELFIKYDDVIDQIERMENEQAILAEPLVIKQENEEKLNSNEARILKNSGIYLRNYAKIKKGINGVLGQKADCDNLIPMYNKDFEEKKGDKEWLKVAASRMSAKDCTSDPLFFKLVESLHELEPSARTAFYLGRLAEANRNKNKALEYYKNAAELETNPLNKAKDYFEIAEVYRDQGAFSSARKYYNLALENKPSLGIAYLRIADMIAKSANDCGSSTFEKRAIYWKAAKYAKLAASVDASINDNATQAASSYEQRAPSKADIFQSGMAGKTISFSCWVGGSVKVPSI